MIKDVDWEFGVAFNGEEEANPRDWELQNG